MDIKVITIGEPDINALPTDERNIFFETLLENIEKLHKNSNCPADMPELSQNNNEETRLIGMKDYFEELYKKYADCKKREKRDNIILEMQSNFERQIHLLGRGRKDWRGKP